MTLSVIGAGLGRTGTLSLKAALEHLGFGPCYHMAELFLHMEHVPLWIRAAEGEDVWDELFDGYVGTVDYPGCSFWRELAAKYPSAKVILSVRDANKWFDSTQETIFSPQMEGMLQSSPLSEFFRKTAWRDFSTDLHDRKAMVAAFQAHNAEVMRSVPKERLLVFEASEGWPPLCNFLGVPEPDAPYPRANSREEYGAAHSRTDMQGPLDLAQFRSTIEERLRKAAVKG